MRSARSSRGTARTQRDGDAERPRERGAAERLHAALRECEDDEEPGDDRARGDRERRPPPRVEPPRGAREDEERGGDRARRASSPRRARHRPPGVRAAPARSAPSAGARPAANASCPPDERRDDADREPQARGARGAGGPVRRGEALEAPGRHDHGRRGDACGERSAASGGIRTLYPGRWWPAYQPCSQTPNPMRSATSARYAWAARSGVGGSTISQIAARSAVSAPRRDAPQRRGARGEPQSPSPSPSRNAAISSISSGRSIHGQCPASGTWRTVRRPAERGGVRVGERGPDVRVAVAPDDERRARHAREVGARGGELLLGAGAVEPQDRPLGAGVEVADDLIDERRGHRPAVAPRLAHRDPHRRPVHGAHEESRRPPACARCARCDASGSRGGTARRS